MDNLEYLNEISKTNRAVKNPKQNALPVGLIVKLVAGGVVLFFLLMMIGSLLGGAGGVAREQAQQIYVRTTNLNETLDDYTKHVKSSKLRAIGGSLEATLTNAANQLSTYLAGEADEDMEMALPAEKGAEEAENINNLNTSLLNAKLNGILDRIYANEIGLQVSLLLSMVSQAQARAEDSGLVEALETYHSSLETIHQSFEDFVDLGN